MKTLGLKITKDSLVANLQKSGLDNKEISKKLGIAVTEIEKLSKTQEKHEIESKPEKTKPFSDVEDALKDLYPSAFNACPKPLKIGIINDLTTDPMLMNKISRTRLRKFLILYTKSVKYLKSFQNADSRIDLLGNPCDEITKEHKDYANEQLIEKLKARKKYVKNKNGTN